MTSTLLRPLVFPRQVQGHPPLGNNHKCAQGARRLGEGANLQAKHVKEENHLRELNIQQPI